MKWKKGTYFEIKKVLKWEKTAFKLASQFYVQLVYKDNSFFYT